MEILMFGCMSTVGGQNFVHNGKLFIIDGY